MEIAADQCSVPSDGYVPDPDLNIEIEIAVKKLSELTREITVTVPANVVQEAMDKAYGKLKKDVHLKGFRKGKAPMSILEKNYGERVQAEVAEKLVQATYFEAVEQKELDVVVHPEIRETRFADDGTFVYVAFVDVKPVFEISEYKGVELEKSPINITDADIDRRIEDLRRKHAVLRVADEEHGVAVDDIVMVDFQGFHNEKPMKEVHNENYAIDVGTKRLGAEFEEQLLGLKKGESALYETVFPADYPNPVMAGKTIEFKVDVKEIKERVKPVLDDAFAQDVNPKYATLADLRADIAEQLRKQRESAQEGDLADQLMQKLISMNTFPVPERAVNYEIQEMINQTEEQLKRTGLTLETAGLKREEMAKQHHAGAEKRVRGDFLLKKIAELEDIKLADEDIERGYQRIAKQYNMTVPDVKKYFQRREEIMPFLAELLNEKILRFLVDAAKITEAAEAAEAAA
ncbi:trigger factor [Candidatus Electronema sp. PJ]|uniref:trigger factor n=1 Tax=Candidatus Electronema sp. PJ TaxID=3401572 RepID=UPI003AA9BC3A